EDQLSGLGSSRTRQTRQAGQPSKRQEVLMTTIRHEPSDDGPRTVRHVDFTTRETRHELADVVCVGFGPANIALAIALDEIWPQAPPKLLEKPPAPGCAPEILP